MNRPLFILSSLLVLTAGCRHAQNVPTLPASHGHLSMALHRYLKLVSKPLGTGPAEGSPEAVVEPAQAPAVFAEAVQVLKGHPSDEEVQQASADLGAACEARFQQACDFLRDQYQRPENLDHEFPTHPKEALLAHAFGVVVLKCRLGIDGRLRACEVLERAPYGFTEAVLEVIPKKRYRPAALAGHPIEIPYNLAARMTPTGVEVTPEQQLEWDRKRTENFPKSPTAWSDFAERLAKQAPDDPGYVPALQHVSELDPRYWWSANELAWTHAQAGRFDQAAPFSRRAREAAPLNAYVLETSAATLFGLGQCAEAVADQRSAVEKLPEEWPAPERERFQRRLQEYTQQCSSAAATPAPSP